MTKPTVEIAAALRLSGARFDALGKPADFGEPEAELAALETACGVADRTRLSRLVGTGPDLLDLLHRLSTQDLRNLADGDGAPTVLTTAKGRIVARLFVHRLPSGAGVLLVGGEGCGSVVLDHLRRYTFAEDTGLADRTGETFQFAVLGRDPRGAAAAAGIPVPRAMGTVPWRNGDAVLHVVGADGSTERGLSVIGPRASAAAAWELLCSAIASAGGRPCGESAVEAWRVRHGIPASGHELTDDRNPLEAGLWSAVSFSKGCYVGQEVVARLNTYDKVARLLVGLQLSGGPEPCEVGSVLVQDGTAVGEITSVAAVPGGGPIALGFLKRHEADLGRPFLVGSGSQALEAAVTAIHGRKPGTTLT